MSALRIVTADAQSYLDRLKQARIVPATALLPVSVSISDFEVEISYRTDERLPPMEDE